MLSEGIIPKGPCSIYERARDVARSHAGTEGFERSRHDHKRVEMRFAHLKRILRLGRLRLRGPRGAQHLFIRQQTAAINAIRAHLAEFGIVAPVGRHGVDELRLRLLSWHFLGEPTIDDHQQNAHDADHSA